MKPFETYFQALHLTNTYNIPVFPLAEGTKEPPILFPGCSDKNKHHGWRESTLDNITISDWFHRDPVTDGKEHPYYNLGINLQEAGLLVVDLDRNHESSYDGIKRFNKFVADHHYNFPWNTYTENTPNGGLHVFLSVKEQLKHNRVQNVIHGVDLLNDFTVASPSEINGKQYNSAFEDKNHNEITMDYIKEAPEWLIELLNKGEHLDDTKDHKKVASLPQNVQATWTGNLLDRIVQGTGAGNRNNWLVSIAGSLFRTRADPDTVYKELLFANSNCQPPLSIKEVDSIFKSVSKYHMVG